MFHVHTNYSYDSLNTIPILLKTCYENGISILSITDHNSMDSYPFLQQYIYDHQLKIQLIPSEEILTKEGSIIGMFLQKTIPMGLSFAKTIEEIHSQGGVVYLPLPHKVNVQQKLKYLLNKYIDKIDIIEGFNSRSLINNTSMSWFARERNKNLLWGSNAHFPFEILSCIVSLPEFEMNKESFLKAVSNAQLIFKRKSYRGIVNQFFLKKQLIKKNKSHQLNKIR